MFVAVTVSVKAVFSSAVPAKNIKIKIYKIIILPLILYKQEILSVIFRQEYRLRVFGTKF
jgi:hypothetical protein